MHKRLKNSVGWISHGFSFLYILAAGFWWRWFWWSEMIDITIFASNEWMGNIWYDKKEE